jgi:RimJ/RimL family protein N-acetyltransferase
VPDAADLLFTARLVLRTEVDPAARFRPGRRTLMTITRADTDEAIGEIDVRIEPEEPTAEISGVGLADHARGQGYATEALDAVVAHLLGARGFVRVVAFASSSDERAQRLLERVGLRAVAADGDDLVYLKRAGAGRASA